MSLFGGAELHSGGCSFTSTHRVILQGLLVFAADGGLGEELAVH